MTARPILKENRSKNRYFDGDVGRKTGWKPTGNIAQDEEGFDDFDKYFESDDEQNKQIKTLKNPIISSSRKYGNGLVDADKMQKQHPAADFVSKPLVGRTPPAPVASNSRKQLQPNFQSERPTLRSVPLLPLESLEVTTGPYAFKATRRVSNQFAPPTQSKLRNSISRQDLQDEDEDRGILRSRVAPKPSAIVKKTIVAKPDDSSSSDEEGPERRTALRKRLGLTNSALSSAPFSSGETLASSIVDLSSIIKSTAVKPIPTTTSSSKKPVQHSSAAHLLPEVFENRRTSITSAGPEEVAEADSFKPVAQDMFDDAYNDEPAASLHDSEQDTYQQEDILFEEVQEELPVVKKSAKKVNIVTEEEEKEEEAKPSYFDNSHFDDDYGNMGAGGVSSSDPDEFDFQPPSGGDLDDEESEHVYDEDEEEEVVVKPKKSSKSKKSNSASSTKKASKKSTSSIPSKYEGVGERIGPNAVKIPVQRVQYDDDEEGLRKSKRSRIAPVAFWKNEKALYGRRDSGITLQNVIRVFDETKPLTKSKSGNGNSTTTITVKASKTGNKSSSKSKKEYDIPEPPAEIKVINYVTKQEEYQKIAVTPYCQDVNRSVSTGSYNFQKVFSEGEFIASGVLELPVGSSKPSKNSHGSAMVFVVVSGVVEVEVHKTSFTLAEGGQFFVPRGNQYAILNVGSEEAKLYFCHGKLVTNF